MPPVSGKKKAKPPVLYHGRLLKPRSGEQDFQDVTCRCTFLLILSFFISNTILLKMEESVKKNDAACTLYSRPFFFFSTQLITKIHRI